ncbi:RNA polymerase sigma factor [Pseudactinotalea sp.]|uniref:RNA polymerase sigma factor n=1 Tax=Pseudactinotalea sp. TaxID=1926260 RepID=UPI003B3B0C49
MSAPAAPDSLAVRAGRAFAAYRAGESGRMAEVVQLLNPVLWRTARSQGTDAETAADVVQVAWLRLVEHADRVADPQALLKWLIVTVRRECWRRTGRDRRQVPTELDHETPSLDLSPEALAELDEDQRVLWTHVATLSERCRALLQVIAFADRPDYATISTALGMPVGSIGPTRGRCLDTLRRALRSDTSWGAPT